MAASFESGSTSHEKVAGSRAQRGFGGDIGERMGTGDTAREEAGDADREEAAESDDRATGRDAERAFRGAFEGSFSRAAIAARMAAGPDKDVGERDPLKDDVREDAELDRERVTDGADGDTGEDVWLGERSGAQRVQGGRDAESIIGKGTEVEGEEGNTRKEREREKEKSRERRKRRKGGTRKRKKEEMQKW